MRRRRYRSRRAAAAAGAPVVGPGAFFAVLCALLAGPLSGAVAAPDGYSIESAITLPPTYYVGDHVELRLRLDVPESTPLSVPEHMPSNQWVTVDSIQVDRQQGTAEVHLFFASYAPGKTNLPPIPLGGITLSGLTVTTTSLLKQDNARLSEPRGQLLLPGSTLLLAIVVGILIAVPLGGWLLYVRARSALVRAVEERRQRRPWRRFDRALSELRAMSASLDAKSFYVRLCDELRSYLGARLHANLRSVTAREFDRSAATWGAAGQAAAEVLRQGDLVKFAGSDAGADLRADDLGKARGVALTLEEERRGGAS